MNIDNKINELKRTKKEILAARKDLEEEQKQEMLNIEMHYNTLISAKNDDLIATLEEIVNQYKIIEEHSKFNLKDIGIIIASLMSIYEGEEFLVEEVSYQIDKGALSYSALLVANKKKYECLKDKNVIFKKDIDNLIKNHFAIKLLDNAPFLWEFLVIPFYKVDFMNRIQQNVNFKKFTYVKDFIEYVIDYRIENNIGKISLEKLRELENRFICCNAEQIEEYHKQIEEKKKESFEISLEHDRKVRKRKLQKILDNNKK